MTDTTDNTSNDVYDDPDNILADTDDTVEGGTELPDYVKAEESQSIFTPELRGDDRGTIDELSQSDPGGNKDETSPTYDEEQDEDGDELSNNNPQDEKDGSEG